MEEKNIKGENSFLIACREGHFEIVKLLIENNCKMEEKNKSGMNGFMISCKNGQIKPLTSHYQL